MQQYYTCPFCGNPVVYAASVCGQCGGALTWGPLQTSYRQSGEPAHLQRTSSIRGLKIAALITGILGFIMGLAVGILIFFVGLVSLALKYESRYSILIRDYPLIGLAALLSYIVGIAMIWPYPRLAGIMLITIGACSFLVIGELGIVHLTLIIVAGVLALIAGILNRSDTAV